MINPQITFEIPKEQFELLQRIENKNPAELYVIAMHQYLDHHFSANPDIIYKYRKWDKFEKRVLTHNEFVLTSPKSANDPFDLHIPLDYDSLDNDDKISDFFDLVIESMPSNIQPQMKLNKALMVLDFKKDPKRFADQHSQGYFKVNDAFVGFFCVSEKWDNVLMWSHYSDCHKGFCVGLNKKKMIDVKMNKEQFFGGCGPISYIIDLPKIDPTNHLTEKNITIEQMSKAWDWGYEKEIRFLKLFDKEITDENRKFYLTDDYIEEIIIGLNTPKKDEEEIIFLARKKQIPVYKIKRKNNSFSLVKELL